MRAAYPDTQVLAVDIDEHTLTEALARDWATAAALPDDPAFERFVVQGCDLVVLATPVGVVAPYFEDLARWDYRGIVTDTASTKARIVALADRSCRTPRTSCRATPWPARRRTASRAPAPTCSRARIGYSAPTPTRPPSTSPGCTSWSPRSAPASSPCRAKTMTKRWPWVSHVPHIVASSLVQLASRHADDQQALMRLAAGGFKDSTRIAAGSPELWCGIAFDNKEALACGLSEMQGIIASFADALDADDRAALTALLAEAAAARRALPAAWVPSTERLLEVRIPMEDRPGVVAEVTTVTSSVGCNIQSIEIDHVTEDSAVLSLVLTDEGDIGQLSAQLINAGFSVSFSPLTAKEHTHVA